MLTFLIGHPTPVLPPICYPTTPPFRTPLPLKDRQTKQTLARGCREDGLYVLRQTHEALVTSSSCPKASFELWHSRLGHMPILILSLC
ncbi:hypothetical protein Hanom_Chr15g01345411 [Helianthus anomalus]